MKIPYERVRRSDVPGELRVSYSNSIYPDYVSPAASAVSYMSDSFRGGRVNGIRPMHRSTLVFKGGSAPLGYSNEQQSSAVVSGSPLNTVLFPYPTDNSSYWCPLPSDTIWFSHGERAYIDMLTQVEQDVSLFVSVYELKDIAGLAKQILDILGRILKKVTDLMRSRSFREAVKGLSDKLIESAGSAYIGYKFGLAPTVADVKAVRGLLGSLNSDIERLRALNGKTTRLTASSYPDIGQPPAINLWNEVFVGYPTRIRYRIKSSTHRFNYSGMLTALLDGLDSLGGWVRGFMTKTGLTNPVAIMWELTSNSWFIDWFFGISGLLSRFAIKYLQPYKGVWELQRQCTTYIGTWIYEVQVGSTLYNNGAFAPWGELHARQHARISYIPVPSVFNVNFDLSPGQLLLSGALVASKG